MVNNRKPYIVTLYQPELDLYRDMPNTLAGIKRFIEYLKTWEKSTCPEDMVRIHAISEVRQLSEAEITELLRD